MSDQYEHEIAELRDHVAELQNELAHCVNKTRDLSLAEAVVEANALKATISVLRAEIIDLGLENSALRGTVYELRDTVRHVNQTILSQREINGNLHNKVQIQQRDINRMRNCDNCNEKGCEFSTPSVRETECISKKFKLWEMKPWLTGSGTTS